MFAIDFYRLLRDFCLFILGIYGADIFKKLRILVKKPKVQDFIFFVVSYWMIHTLFPTSKRIDKPGNLNISVEVFAIKDTVSIHGIKIL